MRVIAMIAIALSAAATHGGAARHEGVAARGATWENGTLAARTATTTADWERVYRDDPADSLYRVAREALNRGEYKRAADLFREVQRRYPQSQYVADAMYYQAFSLSRTGNERDLRTALDVLQEQQRRFPQAASGGDAGTLAVRIQGALAHRGDPEAMKAVLDAAGSGAGAGSGSGAGTSSASSGSGAGGRTAACPSEDDENDMRIAALNALLQMDSERAVPILKQVLAKRDECSVALRRKAVFLVAQKQSEETADILLSAARNDPDVEVRRQAVFWLSQVHSDRALTALDSILHTSKDQEIMEKAIFALANTNTARGAEIIRAYALSNDAPDELRAKAVFWLGQSERRSPENTAFLQSLFDKTNSEEIRNAIIQAMSEMPGEDGQRWMLSVVQDSKMPVDVRKKALFWAGQRHNLDINTLLQLYPKLDDQDLKEHFIFVLSERREAAATDKLIDIAKNDKDVEMRKKALFWLAQKNDPRAKQLLLEIINQ